ncbi:MAG TPA: methyltransferase domain-containing protein [Polyangiaceae bacterium]|nr:methyltransferase domain-containing protein [Polyangiaceae bacterium]
MSVHRNGDAVGFFSENAEMFHDLYRAQPEYLERVRIWNGLLDRHATPGGTSLDLGCGPGVFTFHLAKKGGRVVGVDGAADMIQRCRAQREQLGLENVEFVQARLPLVRESDFAPADLVISSSVVEYVDDLDAVLAQFARLTKAGGVVIVSMPNVASISRIFQRVKFKLTGDPEIYRHIKHFASPGSLRRRVARYGLRLLETEYYTHFTRISKLGHAVRLPKVLTEDLFVAVFRKA